MVKGCVDLLRGAEVDDDFIVVLGGEHGVAILEGRDGGRDGYWPSVWAVRGLLHVWDDVATTETVRAMAHSSWRVREMAAKVVARHHAMMPLRPSSTCVATRFFGCEQPLIARSSLSRASDEPSTIACCS